MSDTPIPAPKKTSDNFYVAMAKDIAMIAVAFLIFSTFGYAAFHIPSSSMEPTLEVGDRIFVAKFPYGYNKFSFYFDPDPIGEARFFEDAPKRGDVVVFTRPDLNNTDFIKRVIGLPGDVIELRQGRVFINGKILPREKVRSFAFTSYEGFRTEVTEYIETLPNGVAHRIYERGDDYPRDNFRAYRVPPDHYFMMGDNRDSSNDSRALNYMGPNHKKYLVGRADITTFSVYDCDQGKPDIPCPLGIPFGRFFRSLN